MEIRNVNANLVAKATGIDRGYLSKLRSNQIRSPHKYISQLADFLEVREAWLLTGSGEPEHSPDTQTTPLYTLSVNVLHGVDKNYQGIAKISAASLLPEFDEGDFSFHYFPKMTDYFPANTFLAVEEHFSGGSGIFLGKTGHDYSLVIRKDGLRGSCLINLEANTELIGRIGLMVILEHGDIQYETD